MKSGIVDIITYIPEEYRAWYLEQQRSLMLLQLDSGEDIIKLYRSLSKSIAVDISKLDVKSSKFLKVVQQDLDEHAQVLETLLAKQIGQDTVKAAEIGSGATLQMTRSVLTKADAAENLIRRAEENIFRVNHDVVLQTHKRKIKGLDLSERIWGTSRELRDNLGDMVTRGVASGMNSDEIAKQMVEYVEKGREAFLAGKEGMEMFADLPKNIEYNARRLAHTEVAKAYGASKDQAAIMTPGAKGMRFMLSNSHPVFDICDLITGADDYGLGQGVYPFDSLPEYPFHPNCLCLKQIALPEDDKELVQDLKQWIQNPDTHPEFTRWEKGLPMVELKHHNPMELMEKNGHLIDGKVKES